MKKEEKEEEKEARQWPRHSGSLGVGLERAVE